MLWWHFKRFAPCVPTAPDVKHLSPYNITVTRMCSDPSYIHTMANFNREINERDFYTRQKRTFYTDEKELF